VATGQQYLERAAQLRMALEVLSDPLVRHFLVLTIESLEEAAMDAQQLTITEHSSTELKDAS
jgi:hypothetical protein